MMNLRCATVCWFRIFKEMALQEATIMGGIEIPLGQYPPGIQAGKTFIPIREDCIEELLVTKVIRKPIVPGHSDKSVKNLIGYVDLKKYKDGERVLIVPNPKSHSKVHLLVMLYAEGKRIEITANDANNGMILGYQIWNTDQPAYDPWQIVQILAIAKTGDELKISYSDGPEKYEGVLTCKDEKGGRKLSFQVNRQGEGPMKLFREEADTPC